MKINSSFRLGSVLLGFISGIILISVWALSSPVGGSPDEPTHFFTIYCYSESGNKNCIDPPSGGLDRPYIDEESPCYVFQRGSGVSCEESNIFAKLSYIDTKTFTTFSDSYYYKLMASFASERYVVSLLSMRIVNGFLFIFVIFLSLFILPAHLRQSFVVSTLVTSIPLGIYIISSINTSAWITIGLIGSWVSLYSIFFEFSNKSLSIGKTLVKIFLYLLSSFLLLSSRSDGIYFFVIVLFSMITFFLIPRFVSILNLYISSSFSKILVVFTFLLGTLLALFYFRSYAGIAFLSNNFNFSDRLFENLYRLPHLLLGPFGTWGLGWLDVWLSPITYISMIFIFLGLLFFSLRSIDLKHGIPIIILMLSAIALPLIILQTSGYLVGEWVQPRYILPLYYPILGLALLSYAGKQKFSSAQLFIIIFLTSIAHSFALFSNLERYLRGQNTLSYNLTVGLEWWWDQVPSPNLIWIIGSISFTVFFTLLTQKTKVNTKHSQFLQ
jgi:hypothetical protein